ncbi:MAG: four helix bundle protein [Lentisphaeria bacterium]|nr:four helix bundle protein [Lentisphaeria bacterium]NQZ66940.1 four helix bundle protein [Lentisphaeria bacterium]
MSDYKELIVWQKSIVLAKEIYMICKSFPRDEIYGLTSQMKRSVISIPSNIAEGSCRSTKKDFAHFISIASGSAAELETQVFLADELNFIDCSKSLNTQIIEIRKMLTSLRKSLVNPL